MEREVLIRCICGRDCKGRRGLKSHQRCCKVYQTVGQSTNDVTTPTTATSTTACTVTERDNQTSSSPVSPTSSVNASILTTVPTVTATLPGIKLPKTKSGWEEANVFFALQHELTEIVDDIDSYAQKFHGTVYDYFLNNYGTVRENKASADNFNGLSIKQLKRQLSLAKIEAKTNNGINGSHIVALSKAIRSRLANRNSVTKTKKSGSDIEQCLHRNFWRACKYIFGDTEQTLPTFSLDTCLNYFKSILHQPRSISFHAPSWFPTLPAPKTPFDTSAPSYKEVMKAVSKARCKSCSCPLDQFPVIALKRCPMLRTFLQKLIARCWELNRIPECWGRGMTILIYKKGATEDPSNFRPITLQPVPYKILASILRDRLYQYLDKNKLIDKNIQKGFWGGSDGVHEHTGLLSHMIRDAKRHQRSFVVALLDLRNAFGEVHHSLISSSLKRHHVPDSVSALIQNIYARSTIQIAPRDSVTKPIHVERGVLQGDPCSPLVFNVCFNSLMNVLSQPKYQQLGYRWGPSDGLIERAWLQFADDAAVIAHDSKSAQTLLNLATAWFAWADMSLRADKCIVFGMLKIGGSYQQFKPVLSSGQHQIPYVEIGQSFKYLGKEFSINMNDLAAKDHLVTKLLTILTTISELSIRAQTKLKLLKLYVPSQLSFELSVYDISATWITQHLDAMVTNHVRKWLGLPVSTCVEEMLSLARSKGGLGIMSLKSIAERLRVKQRKALQNNPQHDMRTLWRVTAPANRRADCIILSAPNVTTALKSLRKTQEDVAYNHVSSLTVQGALVTSINTYLSKSEISRWCNVLTTTSDTLFRFARKALMQQLPTAANLKRWGRVSGRSCPRCGGLQTNKHVLSNCGSIESLNRYKTRHNAVLAVLYDWIESSIDLNR